MAKPVIGILTWRRGTVFEEPGYLRRLVREGRELGAVVYLFSHEDVNEKKRTVRGFVPAAGGGWESRWFPWPDVVIDRCRKGSPGYRSLRRKNLFSFANSRYTRKWHATQLFLSEEAVKRWIPETCGYSLEALMTMLDKYRMVYVKPGNGTGGRSIVRVTRSREGFAVLGRNRRLGRVSRVFGTADALHSWMNRWVESESIRNGSFMIQQGLDLAIIPGRVADVRLLIQKDGIGRWGITGMGVRLGGRQSPTSNLHGGGRAVPFEAFLSRRFTPEQIDRIQKECRELAFAVVAVIERHFGSMMEFGLDIGVDTDGRVWLIEVNPKPGRDIFRKMGRPDLYQTAVRRPILYAMHLASASSAKSGAK